MKFLERYRRALLPGTIRTMLQGIVLKSYLLGLGVSIALGGSYVAFSGNGNQSQAATSTLATVERQTIVSSVKATGKVTFANEQELRFNQKGKVTNVYFKEGDRVTKGQLIAQLDTSSVAADVRQAQLSLAASALQLQQMNGDKEKAVLDAQNALRESERQFQDAQNALSVSQEKLPTDVASAERSVKEKESALEQAKAAMEQARVTTLQDLASTAQSTLSDSEDLLDTLYGILVQDASSRRTSGTKTIEIYFRLTNDPIQKNQVETNYYAATEAIDGMRSTYGNGLAALRDTSSLAEALSKAHDVALALHTLADSTYQLLQGAVDDPHDFTVADINALKSKALTSRSTASTLMNNAETAKASLTADAGHPTSITLKQKQDAYDAAKNALLAAQENLAILKTQTPGDLKQQEAALTKIQDEYKSKQLALNTTSKNSDVNYKLKQNDIAQKSTSLQKTKKTVEDYQLTAPFDGVIRQLDYQIGDNLLDTGEDKFVVLENPDFLVVTILLDQVDIVRVRKDMPARIVLDALPGQEFQGTIYEINSTPVEESGVVSYEVSIRLPTPKDLTILSGMTATVDIETTRKENVLAVPNLALQKTNNRASVKLVSGESIPVEVGATDGRFTEILSGIEEGQSIQSMNVSAVTQSAGTQNAAQIFRLGGGGGGGFPAGGGGNRSGGTFPR